MEQTQNTGAQNTPPAPESPKEEIKKGNKKALIIILVIIGIIIIMSVVSMFVLGWLGKKAVETVIETGTDGNVDIDTDDGTFSITSDDGDEITAGVNELPDNFPSEFPVYDDATISYTSTSGEDMYVYWTSSDDVDKVIDFYQSELEDKDWAITNTTTSTDLASYTIEGNGYSGSVTIQTDTTDETLTLISTMLYVPDTTSTDTSN